MDVILRSPKLTDAEDCARICYAAFKHIAEQHNFPPDFPGPEVAAGLMSWVMSRDDVHAVIAEQNGQVVGSSFLWESGTVAGIGPITVDPSIQNASIGRRMMERMLERAHKQKFTSVRLVQAAYHNRTMALYTKLGFEAREPLSCVQGAPLGVQLPGCSVRAAKEADLPACNRVCASVHGHERAREVLDAVSQGTATVVERDGRITGYATVVGFFGHSVGESNDDLKALIGTATSFVGPGVLIPTRNASLLRWCLERGLRITQPLTLMSMGLYNEPKGAFWPSVLF